jgi:hypothetical protein
MKKSKKSFKEFGLELVGVVILGLLVLISIGLLPFIKDIELYGVLLPTLLSMSFIITADYIDLE